MKKELEYARDAAVRGVLRATARVGITAVPKHGRDGRDRRVPWRPGFLVARARTRHLEPRGGGAAVAMIPVNIITGVLGVGKTTAIRHLLSQRPPNEKWAIVVNEFGALGIDGAVLDTAAGTADADAAGTSTTGGGDGGVIVREVAGGCLCCAVNAPFTVAVTQLLRRAKPDRLLVEPSGMGHPGGLFDALSGEFLRGVLELKATIALVDVAVVGPDGNADHTRLIASEAFRDQVHCADVVVGTKADLASPESAAAFRAWAAALFPAKAEVAVVEHGKLPLATLDVPVGSAVMCAPIPTDSAHARNRLVVRAERHRAATDGAPPRPPAPTIGAPARAFGGDDAFETAGFAFHRDEVFVRHRLLALFESLRANASVVRCKGAVRVGKEWVAPGFASGEGGVALEPVAYRRDSRVEVIVRKTNASSTRPTRPTDAPNEDSNEGGDVAEEMVRSAGRAAAARDWDALERAIKAAVKPPRVK